jgi:biopolymer transport protein ExbB
MNLLLVLLQNEFPVEIVREESYLSLLMKGGWILLPLFALLLLAVAIMIERWLVIGKAKSKDNLWLNRILELVSEGKISKAKLLCNEIQHSSAKVVATGLDSAETNSMEEIQENMQLEGRQETSRLEIGLNYLGITASIAPMLGFLGTIFGVINIFYHISVTNDLSIATISDGLYQKMICSGMGLFVGIIAYTAYYLLNGKIDSIIGRVEKDSNEVLKTLRKYKKQPIES